MKKRILSVLTVIAVALSFASCSFHERMHVYRYDKNTHIKFSWWSNDLRSGYTMEALKVFEDKSSVVVDPIYSEHSGYKIRVEAAVNAGDLPDVVQLDYNSLYEYNAANSELFYDMKKLSSVIKLSNFSEQQLSMGTVDDRLLGIPTSLNSINFFYNTQTLEDNDIKQPRTWGELMDIGRKLRPKGIYAMEMTESAMWLCCAAYAEQVTGKPMFDSSDRMQYTEQEFKIMLEFGKRLLDSGAAPRPDRFRHTDFFSGETAGLACWISDAKSYFSDNSGVNAQSVNISLGNLITVNKGKSLGWYKKPMALYCMSRDTKEPKKVAKFVDHLLNSEEMAKLQGTEKGIPLSKSALEVLESRDMLSDLQAVADRKMNSDTSIKVMSWHLENESFFKLFLSKCYDVTYNGSDPAEKSEEFVKEIRSIEVLFK